jgi:hypothetical protein
MAGRPKGSKNSKPREKIDLSSSLGTVAQESEKPVPKMKRWPKVTANAFYENPEMMEVAIEDYFQTQDANGKPYTLPTLCYHIGFNHRYALRDYYTKYPQFRFLIERTLLRCEGQRVESLVDPDNKNVKGQMFYLQNDFAYSNEKTVNLGDGDNLKKITVEFSDEKQEEKE